MVSISLNSDWLMWILLGGKVHCVRTSRNFVVGILEETRGVPISWFWVSLGVISSTDSILWHVPVWQSAWEHITSWSSFLPSFSSHCQPPFIRPSYSFPLPFMRPGSLHLVYHFSRIRTRFVSMGTNNRKAPWIRFVSQFKSGRDRGESKLQWSYSQHQ